MASSEQQQIPPQLRQLIEARRQIELRMVPVDGEIHEHRLVLDHLKLVESDRRCYHLNNAGTLVERTASAVVPMLEERLGNLKHVLEELGEQYKKANKAVHDYCQQHGLGGRRMQGAESVSAGEMSSKPAGLAV
eukprot:TRINITY_DN15615_c0_g1_i1.p1 TRINITY_DN15615_c0_g1~~TRINITY_DN15615_c0_g1_i1.p1  ORF type:complete len:134 (+),score=24.28 TRINITY_DN15615_c0_g1_i1:73-474(+)